MAFRLGVYKPNDAGGLSQNGAYLHYPKKDHVVSEQQLIALVRDVFELVAKQAAFLQGAAERLDDDSLRVLLEETEAFSWLNQSEETVAALLVSAKPLFLTLCGSPHPAASPRRPIQVDVILAVSPTYWQLFRLDPDTNEPCEFATYDYRTEVVRSFRYLGQMARIEALLRADDIRKNAGLPEDPEKDAELARLGELASSYEDEHHAIPPPTQAQADAFRQEQVSQKEPE